MTRQWVSESRLNANKWYGSGSRRSWSGGYLKIYFTQKFLTISAVDSTTENSLIWLHLITIIIPKGLMMQSSTGNGFKIILFKENITLSALEIYFKSISHKSCENRQNMVTGLFTILAIKPTARLWQIASDIGMNEQQDSSLTFPHPAEPLSPLASTYLSLFLFPDFLPIFPPQERRKNT